MNVDWGRLRAVVLESDDWGLCAWVPDDQAYRALADAPSWRTPAGRIYGRSTLESASDVAALTELLLQARGADGRPAVWQANTVMAAPDYRLLEPPLFPVEDLPLVPLPSAPSRWERLGLWDRVKQAQDLGVWWPELHGLHHIPVEAWLRALRRGAADARRAHEHQSIVCEAVEASGEYDPTEPPERRKRNLELAIEQFRKLFGRAPTSFCPPDYRWDATLEQDLSRHRVPILQGKAEQVRSFPRLRRALHVLRWPERNAGPFAMPARIAFEPRGGREPAGPLGVEAVHRKARAAWARSQPAVISTHRVSYAHLDPGWSQAGRTALQDLLGRLAADGARFLTDAEVLSLDQQGWSSRPMGANRVLVRSHGAAPATVRLKAPNGASQVSVVEGETSGVRTSFESGEAVVHADRGEWVLEWK